MNLSLLKKCPLLILVVCASIALAVWFAMQSQDTGGGAATLETKATEAVATNAGEVPSETTTDPDAAPAGNPDDTTPEATEEPQDATEETTEAADFTGFQTVPDDSYFEDALFIGNSRTVGLYMYGSLPERTTYYASVGLNIYDLLDGTVQVPPEEGQEMNLDAMLGTHTFGKIYIMLGINDLGTGTSESFAEYYRGCVEYIHQLQPDAIIYIQSIINVSAERDAQGDSINNANINEKNALLEQIANNDYCFYVNVNEVLLDGMGCLNADYTSDGIHLGGGSLSLWEDYLRTHAVLR